MSLLIAGVNNIILSCLQSIRMKQGIVILFGNRGSHDDAAQQQLLLLLNYRCLLWKVRDPLHDFSVKKMLYLDDMLSDQKRKNVMCSVCARSKEAPIDAYQFMRFIWFSRAQPCCVTHSMLLLFSSSSCNTTVLFWRVSRATFFLFFLLLLLICIMAIHDLPSLSISLQQNNHYQPGDRVIGTVSISSPNDTTIQLDKLQLVWRGSIKSTIGHENEQCVELFHETRQIDLGNSTAKAFVLATAQSPPPPPLDVKNQSDLSFDLYLVKGMPSSLEVKQQQWHGLWYT